MSIFRNIFRKRKKITGIKTTSKKSSYIGIKTKYMPNRWAGGGHKWTDHFRNVRYR